jgi:hypothetical protein
VGVGEEGAGVGVGEGVGAGVGVGAGAGEGAGAGGGAGTALGASATCSMSSVAELPVVKALFSPPQPTRANPAPATMNNRIPLEIAEPRPQAAGDMRAPTPAELIYAYSHPWASREDTAVELRRGSPWEALGRVFAAKDSETAPSR